MIWKPIPSFPDYEASDQGDIRRIGANVSRRLRLTENGYLRLIIYRNGKPSTCRVNRLVCEAFHGPSPSPGLDAAHEDGNRQHNQAINLAWKTRLANTEDMKRHGTVRSGEQCTTHLTKDQVDAIRAILAAAPRTANGKYLRKGIVPKLMADFGVCRATVWNLQKRMTWKEERP